MVTDKVLDIIESLYPDFREYEDNSSFYFWMDYACELDLIRVAAYNDAVTDYLNNNIAKLRAGSAQHDACVDVASTLQESVPAYQGVFIYE